MPYKDPVDRRRYLREWKRLNRDRVASYAKVDDARRHANERAGKYGAPGEISATDVREVLSSGRCHYCGATDRLGLDHVQPLHAGGMNARENLVCCCQSCNASKFRGDAPGRWSRLYDSCVRCGTSERRHIARGMCSPCYQAVRGGRRLYADGGNPS